MALVDAYSMGRHLLPALGRHDVECFHVRSPAPDVHLAKLPVPDGFAGDVRHDGDVAATAAVLRGHGVDHVVAAGESGVELADRLAAELGAPGNGMSRPTARRNKYDMVLALRAAGLDHAATIVSADADEVVAWAERTVGYPVVLKPVASAGTDNVVACSSPEQVRATHEKILASTDRHGKPNTVVLAQEFLAGDEYFVNTVSRDGRHHTGEIWRYHKIRSAAGNIIYDYDEPLAPEDPVARTLSSYTHQVLDALEVRNWAAHTEVMMTERGPVLVECAARFGGGQVPELNTRCFGTNQVELFTQAVVDPEAFNRLPGIVYELLAHVRDVSLINSREQGIVPSHGTMAAIRALPSYAHTLMAHPEGHPIPRTVDVATQPGWVFLVAEDPEVIRADYRTLRQIERDYLYDGQPDIG
ncbi:ATP-grasp domain-containing protein [Micromonospora sp. WMMD882]|uniref:ATP-grasp domain-containing protein n=1 Tax=Micromonospora sp. WMMD882 TaxID=3015151 RepID=UPI00248B9248|nr:ATP-grasp domain-containing protein [Micromonospora sp. WMMD882]WBB77893.1 ATP-grasp domain-containing protein [Micromonospora sp. WMMD882]